MFLVPYAMEILKGIQCVIQALAGLPHGGPTA